MAKAFCYCSATNASHNPIHPSCSIPERMGDDDAFSQYRAGDACSKKQDGQSHFRNASSRENANPMCFLTDLLFSTDIHLPLGLELVALSITTWVVHMLAELTCSPFSADHKIGSVYTPQPPRPGTTRGGNLVMHNPRLTILISYVTLTSTPYDALALGH